MQTTNNELQRIGYTIKEVCALTTLGRTTVYSHIAAGRLRVVRVGGRTIVPADAVRDLMTGVS